MSNTIKGSKGWGYDYWGRRAHSRCTGVGRIQKKITHRVERAICRQRLRNNPEDLPNKRII